MSITQLEAQYSPEQLGSMDFSGYEAGQLGTSATTPGMTSNEMWGVGLGTVGMGLNAVGAVADYKLAKGGLDDARKRTGLLREQRDETAKFKSGTASAFR